MNTLWGRLLGLTIATLVGIVVSSAARADDGDAALCSTARTRVLAALQRAERSVARAQISLLRVRAELSRVSRTPENDLSAEAVLSPVSLDAGVEEIADEIWRLEAVARKVSEAATTSVKAITSREIPEPSFKPPKSTSNEAELLRPADTWHDDCYRWARFSELGGFRAEQHAQWAEVAAEQAIAAADFEIAKATHPQ